MQWLKLTFFFVKFCSSFVPDEYVSQVKETAANVDDAVRELPDANTVTFQNNIIFLEAFDV